MSNITREQIKRLENVGLVIIKSIQDEYRTLDERRNQDKELIDNLYSNFGMVVNQIKNEDS